MLDGVTEHVTDGVCDGVCDGVWLFGKDSFKGCPLTISGYAFLINGGAISWSSKKQELVTLSTAKSEYVAATYATKEALWL